MKTKQLKIIGLGILVFTLLIPNVSALSGVSFKAGDAFIYKLDRTLYVENQVDIVEDKYLAAPIAAIENTPGILSVGFVVKESNATDYDLYGWENQSIWKDGFMPFEEDFYGMNESESQSFYKIYFNEETASMEDITAETAMEVIGLYNVWLLSYFTVYNVKISLLEGINQQILDNETTINEAGSRYLDFEYRYEMMTQTTEMSLSWTNMTLLGNHKLTYGEESNVLVKHEFEGSYTYSHYDTGVYNTTVFLHSETWDADYPDWLAEDLPNDGGILDNIPGFPVVTTVAAILAGITLILMKKRR